MNSIKTSDLNYHHLSNDNCDNDDDDDDDDGDGGDDDDEDDNDGFVDKQNNNFSIIDKKLHLNYDDLILDDLDNEKLLNTCNAKDEYLLSEFQLDELDDSDIELSAAVNDMVVAGELLPSTTCQPIKNTIDNLNDDHHDVLSNIHNNNNNNNIFNNFTDDPLSNYNEYDVNYKQQQQQQQLSSLSITQDKNDDYKKINKQSKILRKNNNELNDDIMAVVAISTDKISNMTQIVINTGKEEQIYQGKTSELMKTTGYYKISSGSSCLSQSKKKQIDYRKENNNNNNNNNNQEIKINKALEEFGYTEDILERQFNKNNIYGSNKNGNTWICPRIDCNCEFNRIWTLKSHLLAHHGIRPFKCDYDGCNWAFYSDFKLKRHKETHLKKKDFTCKANGCNRRFTTIYNLYTHEKLHQRPNHISCNVSTCNEMFQTKRALELHMKSHDSIYAPFICLYNNCHKRYYTSNALTSHQRCHNHKESDLKCNWPNCNKVFDIPCRLKAHLRTHTGTKPYACIYPGCQWAFTSSSKLKRHEKKHTNERKFICDVDACAKAFMRSEHLKEHKLTHQDERYFQCTNNFCDATFSAKSSLYVHMKKHHNNNNNDCYNVYCDNDKNEKNIQTNVNNLCNNNNVVKLTTSSSSSSSSSNLFDNVVNVDNDICHSSINLNNCIKRKYEGCARTNLTSSDVWKLKKKITTTLNTIGPLDDVDLGSSASDDGNLNESTLLLSQELPSSIYYQELILSGTNESQILYLDSSSTSETTILD